jgi:hypothetical protein
VTVVILFLLVVAGLSALTLVVGSLVELGRR